MDAAPASVRRVIDHIVASIEAAPVSNSPFEHLILDDIFPADVYAGMLETMPGERHFRDLPGHRKANIRGDGRCTRIKLDLLPEFVRHLDARQRPIWGSIGQALTSRPVRDAFVRRLAPGLGRRFGEAYSTTDFFPMPMLTRDTTGYRIGEHTDTLWKGITVQIYLPPDESLNGIGTVFSERLRDGTFRRVKEVAFVPNHGYAFAVGDDTWHSVDPVREMPRPRDSILHTYFVDQGVLLKLRNRGRRLGNLLLNEARTLGHRR